MPVEPLVQTRCSNITDVPEVSSQECEICLHIGVLGGLVAQARSCSLPGLGLKARPHGGVHEDLVHSLVVGGHRQASPRCCQVLQGAEDRQLELGILESLELQVLQRIMDSEVLVALQRVHDAPARGVLAVTGGRLASPRLYLLATQAAAAAAGAGAVAMI